MQDQVPESHRRDENGQEVHYTDLKTVMQATGSVAQRRAMKVRSLRFLLSFVSFFKSLSLFSVLTTPLHPKGLEVNPKIAASMRKARNSIKALQAIKAANKAVRHLDAVTVTIFRCSCVEIDNLTLLA